MKINKQVIFKSRIYHNCLQILKIADSFKYNLVSDVLLKQLVRSSTSVMANYIEGLSAVSSKDRINFFGYCLKSANESKVWIQFLKDTDRIDIAVADNLIKEFDEFAKIFAATLITMKSKLKK